MSTFRMSRYAEDDGELRNAEDAEFLRRKLKEGDVFDFAGVRAVTDAFLDALFQGIPPESLVESFQGVEGAVADALSGWLDRAAGPVAPRTRRRRTEPPVAPAPPPPAPVFEAPVSEGEKYTPTRLANRLRGQLRRYLESAYPLSDATLIKARRKLLDADDGTLIAQEPFVETTPRYRVFGGTYADLGLRPETAALFARLSREKLDHDRTRSVLFTEMYEHQAQALRAFLADSRDLVVATGTGSGKTECFLLPLLARLHEEAAERSRSFARRAMRSLILYPMNALVNDQLARLRLLLGTRPLWTRSGRSGAATPCSGGTRAVRLTQADASRQEGSRGAPAAMDLGQPGFSTSEEARALAREGVRTPSRPECDPAASGLPSGR